jgi:hypothetical protein
MFTRWSGAARPDVRGALLERAKPSGRGAAADDFALVPIEAGTIREAMAVNWRA